MDDTQLTEKAIQELMREMGEIEQARNGPQERKKNPLGRPTLHSRFLNRTVNSVMQHNKREIERTQTSSRQMLHEMDNRDRMRAKNAFFNGRGSKYDEPSHRYKVKKRKSRSRARKKLSSRSSSSSSSNNSRSGDRTHHKKRKKKHKKRLSKKTKRGKRNSSISSSSTTQDSSSRSRSSSTSEKNVEVVENGYVNSTLPLDASYMQTNYFALAAMAMSYGHMQGVFNTTNSHVATSTSTDLLQDDKLSDTSLNGSLTKELALTDNNDSDDNDEQCDDTGMLTFDLSTSDEDEKDITDQNKRLISTNRIAADCDSDSSASCISVDSVNDKDIGSSSTMTKTTVQSMENTDDVQVLSSSDSEEETVEIISVHQVKNHQVTVDLTDD